MKTGFKVYDCMTNKPVAARPDNTIYECANIMLNEHVGSLLILEKELLLGIVTEQDIVRKAVAKELDSSIEIKDIMETRIVSIDPKMDIYQALIVMRDNNIRQLPVLESGKLIGIITSKDILKIEPQLFEVIAEKIELKEQNRKPIGERVSDEGICEICGKLSEKIIDKNGSRICMNCKGFL